MNLRFLKGRRPTARYTYGDFGDVDCYSLEGDFGDVCAEAAAELAQRGFRSGPIILGGAQQPFDWHGPGRCFTRQRRDEIAQVAIMEVDGKVVVEVRLRQERSAAGRWIRHLIRRIGIRRRTPPPAFPPGRPRPARTMLREKGCADADQGTDTNMPGHARNDAGGMSCRREPGTRPRNRIDRPCGRGTRTETGGTLRPCDLATATGAGAYADSWRPTTR
jgi:hypothetical protein